MQSVIVPVKDLPNTRFKLRKNKEIHIMNQIMRKNHVGDQDLKVEPMDNDLKEKFVDAGYFVQSVCKCFKNTYDIISWAFESVEMIKDLNH